MTKFLPSVVAEHVEHEAMVVRRAVEAMSPGPVCAIGLIYVDGSRPTVVYGAVLTVEERAARFAEAGDEQGLWWLWAPADWRLQLLGALQRANDPARDRRARATAKVLRSRGDRNPVDAVHRAVARRLADEPPDVPVSDDFIAFETEHEGSEDMFDRLRSYLPPAMLEPYERRGWLRFPDTFDY
jgi:hypothetical protein